MNVKENILQFWKQFEEASPKLLEALRDKDYTKLLEVLEPINDECYRISGAHLFVEDSFDLPEVTLDSGPNKTTQLICDEMKKLAPASVKKIWIVNSELPPLSQKAIEASVHIRDEQYTLADFTAFYQVDPQNQSFVCHLYCPGFSLIENPEYKREMCIYLMELAVGMRVLEAYVSSVDFLDKPEDGWSFCNLTEMYNVITETAERDGWKDYKSALEIHSAYQPHQDFANDSLRRDMKMIHTIHPVLVEESLAGTKDTLTDLKEKGGEFGYIYYTNLYSGKENAVFRQELARQINQLLAPLHCARVIGGAIGKSYSYIDMIVFAPREFKKAFDQIKAQLAKSVELHYRLFEED